MNKTIIDLHTHSNKSDGDLSPADLVRTVHKEGVGLMALTDHDTLDGLEEAEKEAQQLGMNFIKGIEISTKGGRELHILGYNIDDQNPKLIKACQKFMKLRHERERRILDHLSKSGIEITMDDLYKESGGNYIGRPHMAQVLIKKKYVKSVSEAFEKYLATDAIYKIPRPKPEAEYSIEIINDAGGIAVLAHPHSLFMDDDKLRKTVAKLKSYGLQGLECYYQRYSPKERAYYKEISKEYDLLVTGGSDYHGKKSRPAVKPGVDMGHDLLALKETLL